MEDPYAGAIASKEEGNRIGDGEASPAKKKQRTKSLVGWCGNGKDRQTWHVSGKQPPIRCGGGDNMRVQINLAEEILRPATDKEVKNFNGKFNAAVSKGDLWVCRLRCGESTRMHKKMVKADVDHRTNLDSHVTHQPQVPPTPQGAYRNVASARSGFRGTNVHRQCQWSTNGDADFGLLCVAQGQVTALADLA